MTPTRKALALEAAATAAGIAEDAARAAITAHLGAVSREYLARLIYPIPNSDHADALRIADIVLAALKPESESQPPEQTE